MTKLIEIVDFTIKKKFYCILSRKKKEETIPLFHNFIMVPKSEYLNNGHNHHNKLINKIHIILTSKLTIWILEYKNIFVFKETNDMISDNIFFSLFYPILSYILLFFPVFLEK